MRSFYVPFSSPSSFAQSTRCPPSRAFSITACLHSDLFDYTSGRWIFNDARRVAERRRVFNVDGLRGLAAESVGRSSSEVIEFRKLDEDEFNRTFILTMRDGFQMVARIPYPITIPKHFVVASEVATMALVRSYGVPTPEVYGYSPTPDNAAETEYILMEYVEGTKLSDIWYDLEESDIVSFTRQLVALEAKMMSIPFPAGGSLYFTKDLEKLAGKPGIPLEDERFCVGPDTSRSMWYGRRSQLDVDRGPYESAGTAFVKGALKELVYLERFGRPLLPFQRMRREAYENQKQRPSDHMENLIRFLLVAPSLIPRKPALRQFVLRHPVHPGDIFISRSSNSDLRIVSIMDWQHISILPLFLHANIPGEIQNHADTVSQSMTQPSLPDNMEDLEEDKQRWEKRLYRRRLVHYHYLHSLAQYSEALCWESTDYICSIRRRLFIHASDPWEGEILPLKIALINVSEEWDKHTGESPPFHIAFEAEDVRKTLKMNTEQEDSDKLFQSIRDSIGFGQEGWVPAEDYEEAMAQIKKLKRESIAAAESEKDLEALEGFALYWPFDDMDEEEYM